MGLKSISLNNIDLDGDNFDYCDPETINHVRLMGQHKKFKQCKAHIKNDIWKIDAFSMASKTDGGVDACQKMRKK